MAYSVRIIPSAESDLRRLSSATLDSVAKVLAEIRKDPKKAGTPLTAEQVHEFVRSIGGALSQGEGLLRSRARPAAGTSELFTRVVPTEQAVDGKPEGLTILYQLASPVAGRETPVEILGVTRLPGRTGISY